MGNNFCSKCKTKQGQTPLVLFDCKHHTCINCIKGDPAFQMKYKFIQCSNCKLKSLINQQGGCQTVELDIEWQKCKKQNFKQNGFNNQKDYYIWLRQKKLKFFEQEISQASTQKTKSAAQFQKTVINNTKQPQKNQVLGAYEDKILKQYEEKRKKVEFEQQYPFDGMIQKSTSIQLCKICFTNKAQYCINNCGHVCLCQKDSSQTICPICKCKGKTIKIHLKN